MRRIEICRPQRFNYVAAIVTIKKKKMIKKTWIRLRVHFLSYNEAGIDEGFRLKFLRCFYICICLILFNYVYILLVLLFTFLSTVDAIPKTMI